MARNRNRVAPRRRVPGDEPQPKFLPAQQNGRPAILRLVHVECGIRLAFFVITPVKEEHVAVTSALNPFEKLLGG